MSKPEMNRREVEGCERHLLRVFRHRIEAGDRLNRAEIVRMAQVQLQRAERPGARLNEEARQVFRKQLEHFAAEVHDATRLEELRPFMHHASQAVVALAPAQGHHYRDGQLTPEALAKIVAAQVGKGRNDDDIVRRAVRAAMGRRQSAMRGKRRVPLSEQDPLRQLFDLNTTGEVILPQSDVRAQLLASESARLRGLNAAYRNHRIDQTEYEAEKEAVTHSGFVGLLRQAAIFSDVRLREAMGEELWGLCRPVGFGDKRKRTLLVEVKSASLSQEISMRKRELLSRLHQLPGFEGLKDLRFKVVPLTALPFVGKR